MTLQQVVEGLKAGGTFRRAADLLGNEEVLIPVGANEVMHFIGMRHVRMCGIGMMSFAEIASSPSLQTGPGRNWRLV